MAGNACAAAESKKKKCLFVFFAMHDMSTQQ